MVGLYVIIIMLFGMYLFLAYSLIRLLQDNDYLEKENRHLEKRIDNLMECVELLNEKIERKDE